MKTNQKLQNYAAVFGLSALLSATTFAQSTGPGAAVSLNGTNGYIRVPDGPWFTGAFTIESWVYVRNYNGWSRLIDFGNGEYLHNVYLALSEGGTGLPKMGVFDVGGSPLVGSSQQLPLNQWAHLAATYNGTNGTIYINGTNVGSGSLIVPPPNVTRTNNYIGRSNWGGDEYANALFDEVRIWNVARTQPQIAATRRYSLPRSDTNLVGYWKFNEGTGTSAADFTSNARTGTLTGGVTWTNSTAPIVTGFGTAVNLNGSQTVDVPHNASLNAYPLTVMTWFRTTQTGVAPLVNKYVASSFNGYQIFLSNGQLQAWYIRDAGNNVYNGGPLDSGPGAVNDGQWHHAALTVDATGGRLFLDGVLKSSLPWTGAAVPVTTTQPLSFGHYPGNNLLTGQIDEVSVWNAALPAEQIRMYASQGLVGTETNLVAYYRLDEGTNTTTIDGSGKGNNGTLMSGATWVASPAQPAFTARTLAASTITKTNAILNGAVNPNGLVTTAWFEYGTTTNYGAIGSLTSLSNGSIAELSFSVALNNLVAGTLYHYRLLATNSSGARFGDDVSFQTPGGVFNVTNLSDGGPGSLRQLIASATDDDVINIATNGTIVLTNGALNITNRLTILGLGPSLTAVSGNNVSRVFNISSTNANVFIGALTIRDGRASSADPHGGAIFNSGTLAMSFCEITNNTAGTGSNGSDGSPGTPGLPGGNGGGIYNTGFISLFGCTFSRNSAGNGGTGGGSVQVIFGIGTEPGPGGMGGQGGAIYNHAAGTARITECALSTNLAGIGGVGGHQNWVGSYGSGGSGGSGGGVFNAGILTPIALTVVENRSGPGGAGGTGSFDNGSGAPGAQGAAGGIHNNAVAANITPINCIVAGNSAPSGPDAFGPFTSLGHNLIGQTNGATGFINGINNDLTGSSTAPLDPKLTPLGDFGGPTRTYELLLGSPALNAGDDALLIAPYDLAVDQRNLPRKVGAQVDIGAVESSFVWPTPSAITVQITPTQDPVFGSWTATLQGTVNPGGHQTLVYFQFGVTPAYGGIAPAGTLPILNTNNNPVSATISNLLDSRTYHYRIVASNASGIFFGQNRQFATSPTPQIPGDTNGDGIVDTAEFAAVIANLHGNGIVTRADVDLVLANYWPHSPWLQMTNVAGLGGTNVTFALSNSVVGAFTVEFSTNLSNWLLLGDATPRFLFTDTNAPAVPQRYYRLRWP